MGTRVRGRHASGSRRAVWRWAVVALLALPLAPPPALSQRFDQSGRWVATPSLGFSSTHTVVLREPRTDATKVFMFGEAGSNQTMKLWRFLPGDTNLVTPTTDGPRSSLIRLPHPNNLQSDLFCSGHATLPDGRMLLVGGAWVPLSPCREVYTLDP